MSDDMEHKEMKLEQVRDILRNAGCFDIYGTNEQACDLADAIDVYLSRVNPRKLRNEDVERGAIAAFEVLGTSTLPWDESSELVKEAYRSAARVALESLPHHAAKVPDELSPSDAQPEGLNYADGWNACRETMLATAHQSPKDTQVMPDGWREVVDDSLEAMELNGLHHDSSYKNLKAMLAAAPECKEKV